MSDPSNRPRFANVVARGNHRVSSCGECERKDRLIARLMDRDRRADALRDALRTLAREVATDE